MKKLSQLFTIAIFFTGLIASAQVQHTDPLYAQMIQMDSQLFEQGFNNCNYKVLEDILAPDLEFYHDQGGVQNKKEFIEATRKNICGSAYGKITRMPVNGSIEVFPMYKNGVLYGVYVTGTHEFFIQPTGKARQKTGVARFSCLWLLNDNKQWILKRVISYDHKATE
ncbi:nuclear transport factor 2 family protein [Flavobacterium sp. RHBU_3]|uniref:nuclear transport factor 2 family protein n=1 Tax=Flavobacterium sp. RHBU_3 TaxID=3391184 RepID=UPI00398498EB